MRVSGSLTDANGGKRLPDEPVAIWCYSGGWKYLTTVTTDANGNYGKALAPKSKTSYKAVFAGDDVYARVEEWRAHNPSSGPAHALDLVGDAL